MVLVLKIAEKEMSSGSDEVAEILTSCKTKELLIPLQLQRSPVCNTPCKNDVQWLQLPLQHKLQ